MFRIHKNAEYSTKDEEKIWKSEVFLFVQVVIWWGKSPRLKACAMDGAERKMLCDVLRFAKLAFIILHGRKMMNNAP